MAEFNFPDQIGSKILRASKNILISTAQTTIFSLRDKLNEVEQDDFTFENDTTNKAGRSIGASLKGVKKFDNVILSPSKNPTNFRNINGIIETLDPLHLDICTINVSGSTRIIETNLLNQIGSIKEVVGQNEYNININGILVGDIKNVAESTNKPEDIIKNLIHHSEAKVPIRVVSKYLNYLGITHLVIKNFNLPQDLNTMNLQPFTLNCVSDNQNLTL